MARVAINGFGRIGRGFMRAVQSRAGVEVVAVNDLTSPENLAYLLTYDSVYGRAPFSVSAADKALVVAGKNIPVLSERDPAKLPWKDMNIDIVLESTGFFTDAAKAHAHIDAGAKKVVISAPGKGEGFETILIGANEEKFGTCDITSNASCTTNAANPIVGVLDEAIGIERAVLSTTHAYTASQSLVDSPSGKDMKEGRAAALNIVPTSTGAASATALAYPQLKGKFDGISLRVPVPAGSMVDVTFVSKRATTVEEVNNALKAAAQVLAWYDNEMGYVHTLVEHVASVAGKL